MYTPYRPERSPTLVILPGMDGTGLLLEPFCAALARHEIIIIRYPTAGGLGYADLEAVALPHLPQDRPFVLIGESFSGPVATSIAARRPPGLAGLVLCGTFVRNPRPFFSAFRALTPLLPVRLAPTWLLSWLLLGAHAQAFMQAALALTLRQISAQAFRARVAAVLTVDVTRQLAATDCPLLYLQATQDRVVPPRAWQDIHALRPDAAFTAIAGPHFLLQTMPLDCASAVTAFIAGLSSA